MNGHTLSSLIAMLAVTLGEVPSREVVEREARIARLGESLTHDEAISLLTRIEEQEGAPGLAARLARSRIEREARSSGAGASPASGPRFTTAQLVAMFTPSLGREKGSDVVRSAQRAVGLSGDTMSLHEATAILEHLTRLGGVVGTIARFAKARLALDAK